MLEAMTPRPKQRPLRVISIQHFRAPTRSDRGKLKSVEPQTQDEIWCFHVTEALQWLVGLQESAGAATTGSAAGLLGRFGWFGKAVTHHLQIE